MRDPILYIVSIAQIPYADRDQEKQANLLRQRSPIDGHGSLKGEPGTPATVPQNAWLFQSNPVLYDLRGALRLLREQVWSVSRYAKEIRMGDRVYLWEAGREGGVAGIAEIAETARLQPEPPEQLPFARVAEAFAGDRLRSRLRILMFVEPVIPRRSIVSSPELKELAVLRCSRGTNFRLTLDQWQALNQLILGGDVEACAPK